MIKKIEIHRMGRFREKSFSPGKVTLFTGANGSGKTTLLDAFFYALVSPRGNSPMGSYLKKRYGQDFEVNLTFSHSPARMGEEEFFNLYSIRSGEVKLDFSSSSTWMNSVRSSLFSGGLDPGVLRNRLENLGSSKGSLKHNREIKKLEDQSAELEERLINLKPRSSLFSGELARVKEETARLTGELESHARAEERERLMDSLNLLKEKPSSGTGWLLFPGLFLVLGGIGLALFLSSFVFKVIFTAVALVGFFLVFRAPGFVQSRKKEDSSREQRLEKMRSLYGARDNLALETLLHHRFRELTPGVLLSPGAMEKKKRERAELRRRVEDLIRRGGEDLGNSAALERERELLEKTLKRTRDARDALLLERRGAALGAEILDRICREDQGALEGLDREISAFFGSPGVVRDWSRGLVTVEDESGTSRSLEHLSRGRMELFVLAARLVLARRARPGGILFFDEPFGALDKEHTRKGMEMIREMGPRWQLLFFTKDVHLLPLYREVFPGLEVIELLS